MSENSKKSYIDYTRGSGGFLATHISNSVIEDARNIPVERLPRTIRHSQARELAALPRSAQALYLVGNHQISKTVGRVESAVDSGRHYAKYGVSKAQREESGKRFTGSGIIDLDFTPSFAACTANAVTQRMVREGRITQAQHDNMNLRDWADVIGSGWFSSLAHKMSRTEGGFYRAAQVEPGMYAGEQYAQQLKSRARIYDDIDANHNIPLETVFTTGEAYEPAENTTYITAALTDRFAKTLTHRMSQGEKIGCPVAHANFLLDAESLQNTQVQSALEDGRLAVSRTIQSPDGDMLTRVEQNYTAIDNALIFTAERLDAYDRLHGTPVVTGHTDGSVTLQHIDMPAVHALRYAGQPQG